MSYLTDSEKLRLQFEWLDGGDPIGYAEVSQTVLSIARHSMGATVNGHRYTYFPASDELWRDDVLKMVHGWRKAEAKAAKQAAAQAAPIQGELL
jgi:hypothetical protein